MNLSQTFTRPHFCYAPTDPKASDFARVLMADLGQYKPEECDIVVNVGGDGTILWSFHNNDVPKGVPDFALKPPGSNSALFNGHHNINNAQDLLRAFDGAAKHAMPTLKAHIRLADETSVDIRAFQDVVIRSFNAQAVLPEIVVSKLSVDRDVQEKDMTCGLIIATPMGSTAINETYGGHVLSLDQPSIAMTMKGVTNIVARERIKAQGHLSRVLDSSAKIDVSVSPTGTKRLTAVDFDSWTVLPDGQLLPPPDQDVTIQTRLRHIQEISVAVDLSDTRTLLLNPEFRTPNTFD